MSLFSELVNVYDENVSQIGLPDETATSLLPIAHSQERADLQVNVDVNGNFKGFQRLDRELTIVPVEKPRTSDPTPRPIDDKLEYIAGDFWQYYEWVELHVNNASLDPKVTKKYKDKNAKYLNNLKEFDRFVQNNSEIKDYIKTEVSAIYKYMSKGALMHDLMTARAFDTYIDLSSNEINTVKGKKQHIKLDKLNKFVRVNVRGFDSRWTDKNMFNAWIDFYESKIKTKGKDYSGVDYISGKNGVILANKEHPNKILTDKDHIRAKLISSNDRSTFEGRFTDDKEAVSVGYESSQKAQLALSWLIRRQSFCIGTRYYLAWTDTNVLQKGMVDDNELAAEMAEFVKNSPSTGRQFGTALKEKILAGKNVNLDSSFYILELDAATTGRIEITYYQGLDINFYLDKLNNWYRKILIRDLHSNYHFYYPTLYEIAKAVHNIKENKRRPKKSESKEKLVSNTVSDLVKALLGSQVVPVSVLKPLCNRVMQPTTIYQECKEQNKDARNEHVDPEQKWNRLLEITGSLLRTEDSELTQSLQPDIYDRGYLLGRLLFLAHRIELEVIKSDGGKTEGHITNAQRYMSKMTISPINTWEIVFTHLESYLEKYKRASWARKLINQTTAQLSKDELSYRKINRPLNWIETGRLIVGYVHQRNSWFVHNHNDETTCQNCLLLNFADREYLFGRLLSVADWVEYRVLSKRQENNVVTNANRYINAFIQQPLTTWKSLYLKLQPYIAHDKSFALALKEIDLITNLLKIQNQNDISKLNRPLSGSFLISYSQEKEKHQIESYRLENVPINLNINLMDRSYLYGRLLGMADVIEYRAQLIHQIDRPTTALRYVSAFSQRPAYTWQTIWRNVSRYLNKSSQYNTEAQNVIDQIQQELNSTPDYEKNKNRPLGGQFLLGMSQQKVAWYKKVTGFSRSEERN